MSNTEDASPAKVIIQYLKEENINLDLKEFEFQVQTHPDFPSLLSLSDSLHFFNIDHFAAKIDHIHINDLPKRFMAVLNESFKTEKLTYVIKEKGIFKCNMNNTSFVASEESFIESWNGIVLVINKTNDIKTNKENNLFFIKQLALILVSLLVVYNIINFTFPILMFFVLSLIGLFFSIEGVKQDFDIKSNFSSIVCKSSSSSCNSLIKSKNSNLLNLLSFTDASIIFFIGQIISFFLLNILHHVNYFITLSIISLILALPLTFYSIYIQLKIERKKCPICLGIIGVIYLELFFLLVYNNSLSLKFPILIIILFICAYLISFLFWFQLKSFLKEYFALKLSNIELTKFKRNYKLFSSDLKNSNRIKMSNLKSEIIIGKPEARLKISLITNPFCSFCSETHIILEEILKRNRDQIALYISFNFEPNLDKKDYEKIHFSLVNIYLEKGEQEFMLALKYWFEVKDINRYSSRYSDNSFLNPDIKRILISQNEQNMKNEIVFTPTIFINEFQYPNTYKKNDLLFFIDELINDNYFCFNENKVVESEKP